MFNSLSEKFEQVFKKLRSYGKLDEETIKVALREVRIALLEADVNFKVVKEFIEKIKERAVGQEVMGSLTPGQQVIKIVHDEMIHLLGDNNSELSLTKHPAIIMTAGLQGSGKTTTAGKIAYWLKNTKKKEKILLVSVDVHRPAAQEQLSVIGGQLGLSVFKNKANSTDAVNICKKALEIAKKEHFDAIIIDTAGRLQIDDKMMDELQAVKKAANPSDTLLIVDSMTGQEAVNVAKTFNDAIGINSVILTKLDGDTRGGAAISVKAVTGKPICFIGTGEKIQDLEPFFPDRMASRILGMGDVLSLIEKAQVSFDQENVLDLEKKIRQDSFTLNDFMAQLKQIKKMGPLDQVLSMIPGMGKKLKGAKVDDGELVKTEAIINSMTKTEREKHNIINGKRRLRIAKGSGTSVRDVNKLLKQFSQMKQMMKKFSKGIPKGLTGMKKNMFPNF